MIVIGLQLRQTVIIRKSIIPWKNVSSFICPYTRVCQDALTQTTYWLDHREGVQRYCNQHQEDSSRSVDSSESDDSLLVDGEFPSIYSHYGYNYLTFKAEIMTGVHAELLVYTLRLTLHASHQIAITYIVLLQLTHDGILKATKNFCPCFRSPTEEEFASHT